jgi:hypothetical protein
MIQASHTLSPVASTVSVAKQMGSLPIQIALEMVSDEGRGARGREGAAIRLPTLAFSRPMAGNTEPRSSGLEAVERDALQVGFEP